MKFVNLIQYKKNNYSQCGEDGLIEKLLELLGDDDLNNFFVEFGAHDGKTNSNCFNLLENHEYKGLMIEPDQKRFKKLKLVQKKFNKELLVDDSFISISGKNSLDNILSNYNVNRTFDLLSIDVDGIDYHIWNSLTYFKPKIVIIEYNPTFPNEFHYVTPKSLTIRHGSSASALISLGNEKGYTPVAMTDTNLFFLENSLFGSLSLKRLDLKTDRDDQASKIFVSVGYNGELIYSQKIINLVWHDYLQLKSSNLQLLPKSLQKFPEDYGFIRLVWFSVLKKYYKLKGFIKRIFE